MCGFISLSFCCCNMCLRLVTSEVSSSLLQADLFTVHCPASLGRLLLVELDKKTLPLMPQNAWFCSKVTVETPEGETAHFPVYRWISDQEKHLFREGTGQWAIHTYTHLCGSLKNVFP